MIEREVESGMLGHGCRDRRVKMLTWICPGVQAASHTVVKASLRRLDHALLSGGIHCLGGLASDATLLL